MSKPGIQKVSSTDERKLPIFEEIDELADKIRLRAYNLFKGRGFTAGNDIDDWLTAEREICWPAAELIEEDDEFEVSVALAGFDDDDVEITATPREIIVKASHKDEMTEKSEDDEKVRWSQFRSNEVYRQISLPSDIDVEKVEAEMKRGMLKIEAPKAKEAAAPTKKVKVEVSD